MCKRLIATIVAILVIFSCFSLFASAVQPQSLGTVTSNSATVKSTCFKKKIKIGMLRGTLGVTGQLSTIIVLDKKRVPENRSFDSYNNKGYGIRTAKADQNGDYGFNGLPSGKHLVIFISNNKKNNSETTFRETMQKYVESDLLTQTELRSIEQLVGEQAYAVYDKIKIKNEKITILNHTF